jgi:type II secretory pathway component PulJ
MDQNQILNSTLCTTNFLFRKLHRYLKLLDRDLSELVDVGGEEAGEEQKGGSLGHKTRNLQHP